MGSFVQSLNARFDYFQGAAKNVSSGMGRGGDHLIIPLMTAEIFSIEMPGRPLGVNLTADRAVSPLFVGRTRDIWGSYFRGSVALMGMALGALAASMLPKRRRTA